MIAPVRYASRRPFAQSLLTLLLASAATAAVAQQLQLPSDALGAGDAPLLSQGSTMSGGATTTDGAEISVADGGPSSLYSSGTLYNPLTGSHIRVQYNTESYGQAEGNLNIGTMILRDIDGGVGFLDGQVTLNDENNVGFNIGAGYRWLTLPLHPYSPDDAKIMGVSVWADGQGGGDENWFTQIGTSLEFLGDRLDFRANGYAVVGDRTQSRDFVTTGDLAYVENFLAEETVGVLDTALTVAEVEGAARIADLEAWVFGGAYAFAGGGYDEVGGKIGLRGFITPDLNLSVAVTHDELFDTNGVMRLTWFIGRTRRENMPTGSLHDRLRDPVIRNDYIAITESTVFGAGEIITDADDEPIRIVHVDSSAAAGGDGSFENPLNSLDDIETNSLEGDIILAHAESEFTGETAVLQDDQIFVGEGGGNEFEVTTFDGIVALPETAPGAATGTIPLISDAPDAAVYLSDDNTITNLEFDGGVNAIATDTTNNVSSDNATLTSLVISNTTGDAISLFNLDRVDVNDDDDDGDETETFTALGSVTIDEVEFAGVMGNDIYIDGSNVTADTMLTDTISITDITSDGNTGSQSLLVENTLGIDDVEDGGIPTVTVNNYTVTNSGAGLTFNSNEATVTMDDIAVTGTTDAAGWAINIFDAGELTSVNSAVIDNVAGGGILVEQNTANVSIGSAGEDGEVSITNVTGTSPAILVDANDGASTDANGTVTIQNVDIDTVAANGIVVQENTAAVTIGTATEDGEVTITDAMGDALFIDMAEAAVDFDNDSTITGGGNGVVVQDTLEDGDVSIGATVEINDVSGQAVIVQAVDNATVEGSVDVDADLINDGVDGGGVRVSDTESQVDFGGAIETLNTDAVVLTNTQNNVTFSGDIISRGTGDTITIVDAGTNTTDEADITFSGDITNDDDANGHIVVVTGGDDAIFFNGDLIDTGEGIEISGRLENTNDDANDDSVVNFTGTTELTHSSGNSVTLGSEAGAANHEDSLISFTELIIENSGGTGDNAIVGADVGDFSVLNGSILTDSGATAIDLENGSSTNGLTFDSIDVTGGAADTAIRLVDFDGTLTFDEGVLETTGLAIELNDASLEADFLEIDSAIDQAITAVFEDDQSRTLLVNGADPDGGDNASFNGGDVSITTASEASVISSLTDLDELGAIAFTSGSTESSTLTLSDLTTDDGFDFNVTGDGDLSVVADTVVSTSGDTTIDVSGVGGFNGTFTDFETAGELSVASTAGSEGDITVTAISAAETTAFTQVTVNDQGDGSVDVTLDGVEADTGGIDFDSSGEGDATLTVMNGDYAGGIDFTATNDGAATLDVSGGDYDAGINATASNTGAFDVTIDGSPTLDTGGVVITANNDDNFTASLVGIDASAASGELTVTANNTSGSAAVTVTGGTYGGDAAITGSNAGGSFTVTVDGSTTIEGAGGLDINATNGGAFTANVSGVTADNGDFTVAADNTTGTADVTLGDSDFGGDLLYSTDAAGDATFTVTGSVTADGAIGVDIDASNTGAFTADLTGVTAANGGFDVVADADTENVSVTLDDSDFGDDISIVSNGSGTFDVSMNGPVTTEGATGVTITANNGDDFTTTITNITADNGGLDIDADNTSGNATVSVTNGDFAGAIDVTGSNTGDFGVTLDNVDSDSTLSVVSVASMDDVNVSVTDGNFLGEVSLLFDNGGDLDLTFDGNTVETGADQVGLDIQVLSGVDGGEIAISDNVVETGDNLALNLNIDIGQIDIGVVGNEFENNSATFHNTLLDVSGGSTVVGATFTNNTFTNTNAGAAEPELELITSAGAPQLNINVAGNTANSGGGSGNGEILITEGAGAIGVWELDDTFNNTGNRNSATVTFDPNNQGDFDDLGSPPNNPAE